MSYKVLFCGTPAFAVPSLEAIHNHPELSVTAVYSQPDRRSGRGKKWNPSAVKKAAQDLGLVVETPDKISTEEIISSIRKNNIQLGVVVAYGQILSQDFLDAFEFGCVNVHSSLLPRWRGAAPMQRALMEGDSVSGVSLQKVVKKLDAGDIIAEHSLTLPIDMGAKELYQTLSLEGARLLAENLIPYMKGQLTLTPQDEAQVTVAKKIQKEEGGIQWNQAAERIHNQIRGLNMGGPFAFTRYKGKALKIHKSLPLVDFPNNEPGRVLEVKKDSFIVACGVGALEVFSVQPENKARMESSDFIRGYRIEKGDDFESI